MVKKVKRKSTRSLLRHGDSRSGSGREDENGKRLGVEEKMKSERCVRVRKIIVWVFWNVW